MGYSGRGKKHDQHSDSRHLTIPCRSCHRLGSLPLALGREGPRRRPRWRKSSPLATPWRQLRSPAPPPRWRRRRRWDAQHARRAARCRAAPSSAGSACPLSCHRHCCPDPRRQSLPLVWRYPVARRHRWHLPQRRSRQRRLLEHGTQRLQLLRPLAAVACDEVQELRTRLVEENAPLVVRLGGAAARAAAPPPTAPRCHFGSASARTIAAVGPAARGLSDRGGRPRPVARASLARCRSRSAPASFPSRGGRGRLR